MLRRDVPLPSGFIMILLLARSRLSAFLTVATLVGLAPTAHAQTTATLAGSIIDASGGALPGVQLTLRQLATGFTRSAVTGAEGRFVVAGISAGRYELR